jgi:hypothetical protein
LGYDESGRDLSGEMKREAAKQPITIAVSEEQLEAIRAVWNDGDPMAPARITFLVKGKPAAELALAGYRYVGDTCCV